MLTNRQHGGHTVSMRFMAWLTPILVLAASAAGVFPDDGGTWLMHFVVAGFAGFLSAASFYRRDIAWGCVFLAVAVLYQPFAPLPFWETHPVREAELGAVIPTDPAARTHGFANLICVGIFAVHWLIWTRSSVAARQRRNNTPIRPGN